MKPERRAILFCVTILVVVPVLYALGEAWGGTWLAVPLSAGPGLASYLYLRGGERGAAREPAAAPERAQPPASLPPAPLSPPASLPPVGGM